MEDYAATPLKGIGPVDFGMSRDHVRAIMRGEFRSFCKTPSSRHATDAWHGSSFQVFYGGAEPTVEFIELSANAEFHVRISGHSVFDTPALELVRLIEVADASDKSDPEYGFSYIFPKLELSLWRPNQSDGSFASIGLGRCGYFSCSD